MSKNILQKKSEKTVYLQTRLGSLYNGDCLKILPSLKDCSIDTIFADPPFNLNKNYGNNVNDNVSENEYLEWSEQWIKQCIKLLKPGGAFFIYNLPKWNISLANILMKNDLVFRHWIAINITFSLPIPKRLYPSHYSLLYFTKGKPNTFNRIRTPIKACRHCNGDIKDYGGHKKYMNPNGVNLTDVWDDIPPVRHKKYKSEKREANQLSTKLLSRVIELSTMPKDLVLDPFGGSGTTFAVCEKLQRRWIGIEINDCEQIVERLNNGQIENHRNSDFVEYNNLKLIK